MGKNAKEKCKRYSRAGKNPANVKKKRVEKNRNLTEKKATQLVFLLKENTNNDNNFNSHQFTPIKMFMKAMRSTLH